MECLSVVVKEERKLLTVLFPDGRDGRTFTLKVSCPLHTISGILLFVFQVGLAVSQFAQLTVSGSDW